MINKTWNLAPKPSAWRQTLMIIFGILLISGAVCGLSKHLLRRAQQQQQQLRQQRERLAPKLQQLQQLITAKQMLQQHSQVLQQLKQQALNPLTFLTNLTQMPDGIYLTQISVKASQVAMVGKAVTQIQIQQLRQQLTHDLSIAPPTIIRDDTTPPYHWSFRLEAK